MSRPATTINLEEGFKTFPERMTKERALRLENGKHRLRFGIKFLDEALGGIQKNDLIVIGSKTGAGKSQLATQIALENVKQGKTVHFLALEAEEYEIERRIKYQLIADEFYKLSPKPNIRLSYLDWYNGSLDNALRGIEEEIDRRGQLFSNLHIYYRSLGFTVKDFERIALGIKNETDLIIIDHLHYFDYDDENENRAVKTIIKKIRDCALLSAKPIILISHLRKTDKRVKQIVPDIEDFHGSSDIGKIATKAVTLAPCYAKNSEAQRQTYFLISKSRIDGSRNRMCGLLAFNIHNQRYERQYYLGRLSFDETEFLPFNLNEMPYWANNGLAAS